MLGVVEQDETFKDLPANVQKVWSGEDGTGVWTRDLFGDFRVCAVTKFRSGEMQMVKVVGARALRAAPR